MHSGFDTIISISKKIASFTKLLPPPTCSDPVIAYFNNNTTMQRFEGNTIGNSFQDNLIGPELSGWNNLSNLSARNYETWYNSLEQNILR
jgi:hypothetical protein